MVVHGIMKGKFFRFLQHEKLNLEVPSHRGHGRFSLIDISVFSVEIHDYEASTNPPNVSHNYGKSTNPPPNNTLVGLDINEILYECWGLPKTLVHSR